MVKIKVPDIPLKPEEKIPRLIHYCWFGGKPLPALAKRCIKSWKRHLPDYEIILWNEKNFDMHAHHYTNEAFVEKKWAFITDYVRLYALYHYGGIYMDTDVEIIKPIDIFLKHSAFSSFESPFHIPTGLMASAKQNIWIKTLLDDYKNKHFINEGNKPLITNTVVITAISQKEFGLQIDNSYQVLKGDVHIYPSDYFCPMNWALEKIEITKNTYAIHHFSGSWIEGKEKIKYIKFRKKAGNILEKMLGSNSYNIIAKHTWRKFLNLK
jgi:mannosyltransferase OCH1-like enzyme